jgi:Flp pilus assembly protein TadG
MGKPRRRRDSGQSAVETALVLPLVTFMILGTLQLFMLLQAKLMAQYAVYQAAP